MRKLLSLLLALTLILAIVPMASAETINFNTSVPDGYTLLVTGEPYYSIQFWHYSGGYWGCVERGIKLYDKDVANAIKYDNVIPYNDNVNITTPLPEKVKEYLNNGGKLENVKVRFVLPGDAAASKFFKNTPSYTLDSNGLTVSFMPIFAVRDDAFYWDENMKVIVPRIKDGFGVMVCSIFDKTTGKHLGQTNEIETGDIADSNGYLKPRKTVAVSDDKGNITYYDSSQIRIGWGTFKNGGAVGLEYRYPIQAEYYVPEDIKSLPNLSVVSIETSVDGRQANPNERYNVSVYFKNDSTVPLDNVPVALFNDQWRARLWDASGQDVQYISHMEPGQVVQLDSTVSAPPSGSRTLTAYIDISPIEDRYEETTNEDNVKKKTVQVKEEQPSQPVQGSSGPGSLTFQAVTQDRSKSRPAGTAKWTDWVTATLKAPTPTPPKGWVTYWEITSATLSYPKKTPGFRVWRSAAAAGDGNSFDETERAYSDSRI
ncbi:MAG: hypothetical protein HPY90_05615 [Syntrophothermus sp.]|uniref:hypothetical protein n=1 Tax=Syntrophothermus sp. TaxID=2736299 RepID=UPI00257CB8FF|nr:hypothetical protein [Syntrophothermus sp.]NSW82742.1 hypothetical protein [Syntrophothermus sp.]